MEAPAKETAVARAEEPAAPVAKAAAVVEPVVARQAEAPVVEVKAEEAAVEPVQVEAAPVAEAVAVDEPVKAADEPLEAVAAKVEEPAGEKAGESAKETVEERKTAEVRDLPRRAGTMLGLDEDGEIPKEMTEEDAQAKAAEAEDEDAGTLKRKRRGFLGLGRRKKRV